MPETSYSYLDLTVLPALRRKVLSGDAAILFTSDMLGLLWANAAGALLFGGAGIAEMIASPLNANQPFVQQLSAAARQIEGDEPIVRGFRIARGLRTELIQCELARLVLPAGDEAILLTCRDEKLSKPMREHELAENAVGSLTGFADAAAILDDYGLPLAATSSFAELEIDPGELAELVSEASHESDRLIKRAQAMADGSMLGIGIARISDRPGRYLVVCASGSSSSDQGSDKAGEENGDAPSYSTTTLEDDAARDFDDADLETPEDHQQSLFDDRTSEADGAADAGIGDTGDYVPETAAEDIPEDYQEEQQFHGLVAEAAEMAGQTGQDDNYREHDLDVYYDEDTLVDAADLADLGKLDGNPSHDAGDDDETQAADPKPSEPKTAGRSDADPDTLSRSILERWYFGTSLEARPHPRPQRKPLPRSLPMTRTGMEPAAPAMLSNPTKSPPRQAGQRMRARQPSTTYPIPLKTGGAKIARSSIVAMVNRCALHGSSTAIRFSVRFLPSSHRRSAPMLPTLSAGAGPMSPGFSVLTAAAR
ncbi:MAG: hypothetical protein R3D29_05075 [Nitratireductor sp.]